MVRIEMRTTVISVALLLSLSACGGGGGAKIDGSVSARDAGTSSNDPGMCGDDAGLAGSSVGPGGGTVVGRGGVSVVIPPGALAETVNITIREIAAPPGLPPNVGYTILGKVYEIGPVGTHFAQAVTLTLPFDPALLGTINPGATHIFATTCAVSDFGMPFGQVVDLAAHTVSAPITELWTLYFPAAFAG